MVTHALLQFIQTERSRGTATESITTLLKEKGWKELDIDAAFLALLEGGSQEVPQPQSGIFAEFREMLCAVWGVYLTRWKRFVTIGIFYGLSFFFIEYAFRVWAAPVLPRIWSLVQAGDVYAAFYVALPYLVIGSGIYVALQSWYVATLYSVSLKKGETPLERMHIGLRHVPAVLWIKLSIALLLMISIVPVLATAFFTSNPLVLVVFGPFFIMGAGFLGILLSLSLPAYFHGVRWTDAALQSIKVAQKNIQPLILFYLLFCATLALFFVFVSSVEIVAGLLMLTLVVPMQTLFMIALYRRFTLGKVHVAKPRPHLVRAEHAISRAVSIEEKTPTKKRIRTKRVSKAE